MRPDRMLILESEHFARREELARDIERAMLRAGPLALLAVGVVVAVGTFGWPGLLYGAPFFAALGVGTAYGAMLDSSLERGLSRVPRRRWALELSAEHELRVRAGSRETRIGLLDVRALVLVVDAFPINLAGMEDESLIVELQSGRQIVIPKSAANFEDVVSRLRGGNGGRFSVRYLE